MKPNRKTAERGHQPADRQGLLGPGEPAGGENTPYAGNLPARNRRARIWQKVFLASTVIGLVFLALLLVNISNSAFGYVVLEAKVHPDDLALNGTPLEEQSREQLAQVFQTNVSAGLYRRFDSEKAITERGDDDLRQLIQTWVVKPQVIRVYPLYESLLHKRQIKAAAAADAEHPRAYVKFMSWLDLQFVRDPQEAEPLRAGVRTAILGSLWTILIAVLFAFPVGVAAAIYLQEYASDNRFNRVIQTNISNLAGVPSIIYGLLGLAVFVRALVNLTSGAFLGLAAEDTANGRTIISAGLTLGLLILPMIIINAQEALKAVPASLRQASLGLGATQWQTIWHHVLPAALPGILTGAILAISRAMG
ncbi:MAG: phosphate ABC transporter permease PstA, partial [Anaerolineaceae bacterium]